MMYCLLCWVRSNVVPAKKTHQLSKTAMILDVEYLWINEWMGIDYIRMYFLLEFWEILTTLWKVKAVQRKRPDKMLCERARC